MLIRCEIKYNKAFVQAFEDWLQDSYPDDHWMLDKVFDNPKSPIYWEYKHESVEEMFDLWLNVIYQQKVNHERFKGVDVDSRY